MLGLPGRIVEAIMKGPEGRKSATLSIAGVSPVDGTICIPERAFQFWPESISEEPEIGWQFKDIPGASHSLAQWTQNGGRTFSFEVVFSRFMLPLDQLGTAEKLLSLGLNKPGSTVPRNNQPMNVSVREQVQYLRQFYLPEYVQSGEVTVASPPPIAVLYAPNQGWNEDGRDTIWAVMTQCSVNHMLAFPSGEPRLATVSLAFRQVIQWPAQGVIMKNRKMYAQVTNFESDVATGGGRTINKVTVDKGP
jgi:hypothetical protein